MIWNEEKGAKWNLRCSAAEIPAVLRQINDRLSAESTKSPSSLPQEWLRQAKHVLETFPDQYVSRVAATYCSPESLLECDSDELAKVGLTQHEIAKANEVELEQWANTLQKRMRLLSMDIEFRCSSPPFADGGCLSDCGYVVDPWSRVWQVGSVGDLSYIEGWFALEDFEK